MNNFQTIESYCKKYRKEINIINYNDNGMGDVVNKMSYLYNISSKHEKKTTVRWYYNDFDYNKVINSELFFRPCKYVTNIKMPEIERAWDFNKYTLYNHEYWSPRNLKTNNKTKNIAVDIYTFFHPSRSMLNKFKISSESFREMLYETILENNFKIVDMFHLDNKRGSKHVLTDYRDLMTVNIKLLQNVDAFIGIEGNISHLCRAMKIPSLLLYNLINSLDVNNNVLKNVVRPYIDSNLQKLVNSENELLKEIPSFLKKIS